jgi:hypothetical protein
MAADEALAYDFAAEVLRNRGVIDMLGVLGYFSLVSMVLNVARTPAPLEQDVAPLQPFPL